MQNSALAQYFFFGFVSFLFAQEPILIGKFTEVFEDKSKKLSIQEILSPEIQEQFQPYKKDAILERILDSAFWIKIPLQSSNSQPLWLHVASENIWYIDLYDLKNGKYELTYSTGALRPKSTKNHHSYILPISEFSGSKTVYLRLETKRLLIAPIYLGKLEDLLANRKYDYYASGIFFGLQIGLLVYSLLLLNVAAKSFLWFVGYVLVNLLTIPFMNHQLALLEHVGDEVLWFIHKNYFLMFGVLLFFITQYSISFLKLKTIYSLSYLYFTLKIIAIGVGLAIPLGGILFPSFATLLYYIYPWILNSSLAVILVTSYYVQKYSKDKSIRFFTLSWIVLLASGVANVFVNYGWLDYNVLSSKVLYIGVGAANIFTVLAITERLFLKQKKSFLRKKKLANVFYRKKLKQSVDDFEELMQVIPVGIYRYSKLKDGTIKFRYVSPKWCELHGLKQEEILQDASLVNNLFHPDDFPSFIKANTEAVENHKKFLWEGRMVINNKIRLVHIESYPVAKEDGSIDWIGIHYDITENKLQEPDLQIFAKLAENTSDSVIITNAEGLIVWANQGFFEMTGYTLQEALGKKPGDLLQGPETNPFTKARLHNAIYNFQPIREIVLNYTKFKTPYWVDLTINPIFDEKGKCRNFIGIQRNITAQIEENLNLKKEFQEIEQEKKKVLRYVQEKSEFLAAMSHEIRTPLTAIVGFSELLSDAIKDESQKYFVNSIRVSVKNLLEVVNNILDYSKIEAGKMTLDFFKVNIQELFTYCLDIVSIQAKVKNLNLIQKIEPNVPSEVFFDGVKVQQVLINLLSNAIKFTMTGEVELGVKLESHEPELGLVDLTFYVRDTGIGISEERQQAIFESFAQEDSSTQRNFGGTGLGLTISNKLLALMGTQLELKSIKGQGSLFYFTILAKQFLSETPDFLKSTQKQEAPPTFNLENLKLKVLIADDLDVNRFLLSSLVKNLLPKVTIFEASDGKEAVQIYQAESPELVLLDIQMPELNGYETAAKIRELQKDKKLILFSISAGSMNNEEELSLQAGFDKYFTKPISKTEFKESIFHFFKNE